MSSLSQASVNVDKAPKSRKFAYFRTRWHVNCDFRSNIYGVMYVYMLLCIVLKHELVYMWFVLYVLFDINRFV